PLPRAAEYSPSGGVAPIFTTSLFFPLFSFSAGGSTHPCWCLAGRPPRGEATPHFPPVTSSWRGTLFGNAARIDFDQRSLEHDSGARNESERGALCRIGEAFAPDSHEATIVTPRLDEIEPRLGGMRPVRAVGLERPGQNVHQKARLHFDVGIVMGQSGRRVVVRHEIGARHLASKVAPLPRLERRREIDLADLHGVPTDAFEGLLF